MDKKRFRIISYLIMGFFILSSRAVSAQENNVIRLNDLIIEAREHNPDILAAYKTYQASEKLFQQAVSLDDPRLTAGYFAENVETRVGPQIGKYGIAQKFPFFGKLTLKGKIALKDRDMAYQKYQAVDQEVIKNLKYAFFDLYWIRKSTAITKEIKDLMDELEKVAESKYSTGIASQQDVLKAQVEISNLMAKLYTLSEQEVTLKEKINTLLNRPVETPLGLIEEFPLTEFSYELSQLLALAKQYRPEMEAATINIEKNENIVSLKKKDYFPDFTVGVDFIDIGSGHTTAYNDGQDAWMGMVSVNLPIWQDRIKAGVDEAKDKLASSKDSYQSVHNSVAFQIKDALFKRQTAKDLVDLYKGALIPQAQESLKASQAGYETGKTDFLNLIDSERVLLNFKIAYYRAVADYEKSVADLERAVGMNSKDFKSNSSDKGEPNEK